MFNGIFHFRILPSAAVSPVVHGKRRKCTSGGHVQSFTLSMSFLHCLAHSVPRGLVLCPRCAFRTCSFCSQTHSWNNASRATKSELSHAGEKCLTRQKDSRIFQPFSLICRRRLSTPLTVFLFSHDGAGLSSASEFPAFLAK